VPAAGGLQHSHGFTISEGNGCEVRTKESVKMNNEAIDARNFRVWCEHCSIRIAPNEKRVAVEDNKTYHERCYAKSKAIAGIDK
jgi:hypothetical protein